MLKSQAKRAIENSWLRHGDLNLSSWNIQSHLLACFLDVVLYVDVLSHDDTTPGSGKTCPG